MWVCWQWWHTDSLIPGVEKLPERGRGILLLNESCPLNVLGQLAEDPCCHTRHILIARIEKLRAYGGRGGGTGDQGMAGAELNSFSNIIMPKWLASSSPIGYRLLTFQFHMRTNDIYYNIEGKQEQTELQTQRDPQGTTFVNTVYLWNKWTD